MDIHTLIAPFLKPSFLELAPRDRSLDEVRLFDEGYIDSLRLVELILAIEEKLGRSIAEEDLEDENFATIKNISSLIQRYSA